MHTNIASYPRRGYHFQDLYALKICMEWMHKGDRLAWIQFEAKPPEAINVNAAFYLDDIIVHDKKGRYYLYQLKHTEAENTKVWHFGSLVKRNRSKRSGLLPSLLGRWITSFAAMQGPIAEGALITDGEAGDDIRQCVVGNYVSVAKLAKNAPDVLAQIYAEVRDRQLVKRFFESFRFKFLAVDLDEFQETVYEQFHSKLAATQDGINKLLLAIKEECRRTHTLRLSLEDLQAKCDFDRPRPLDQQFQVPKDFQLFDRHVHSNLVKSLENATGGVKVLFGKPGSGKSTYLSVVAEQLKKRHLLVVRHHYFISQNDPDRTARLLADRTIEGFKASFKQYAKELGQIDMRNSRNVRLRKFVQAAIASQNQKGKPVIIILDGLDHVSLEHGDDKQLMTVLSELLVPQQGAWIILGMQPHVKDSLPDSVFARAPEEEWIEIQGLREPAVAALLKKNTLRLNLPADDGSSRDTNSFLRLVHRLFSISEGNPLHLHYCLQQLKNKLQNGPVSEYHCRQLLPYGGNILEYYKSLWRNISAEAKTASSVLCAIEFELSAQQTADCLTSVLGSAARYMQTRSDLDHLLTWQANRVSIYHSSFQQFVRSTPEFLSQVRSVKRSVLKWLRKSPYKNLKWSVVPLLAFDLGDTRPLAKLGKSWLVEALCTPRDQTVVSAQLKAAITAAFHQQDWNRNIRLGWLESYRENAVNFESDLWYAIWDEALYTERRDLGEFRLQTLASPQIVSLLRHLERRFGDVSRIGEAVSILNARHWEGTTMLGPSTLDRSPIPTATPLLINVVSHDRKTTPKRVWDYIRRVAAANARLELVIPYAVELLKTGQWGRVRELLRLDLTSKERTYILERCVEADLRDRQTRFLANVGQARQSGARSALLDMYLVLHGKRPKRLVSPPSVKLYPTSSAEYPTPESEEFVRASIEAFTAGVLYALVGMEKSIKRWSTKASHWSWLLATQLAMAGIEVGAAIRDGQTVSYGAVSRCLRDVQVLQWPDDRPLFELQRNVPRILSTVYRYVVTLQSYANGSSEMTQQELEAIVTTGHYSSGNLLHFLIDHGQILLTPEAFNIFVDQLEGKNQNLIQELPSRSQRYLEIAILARIHKDTARYKRLLSLAANCFIGYRSHKDLFLEQVIDGIAALHTLGSSNVDAYISRIAPMVEHVCEYTDGDETKNIPTYFASLLATASPSLLRKYYYYYAEIEDLSFAEDIFRYVVRELDFARSEDRALASTALDESSWNELKRQAARNRSARSVVSGLKDLYGDIRHEKRDYTSPPWSPSVPSDLSDVSPEQLLSRVAQEASPWDQNRYIEAWAPVWFRRKSANMRRAAFAAVHRYVQELNETEVGDKIFDLLAQAALNDDQELVFRFLCQAQRSGSGWTSFYSDRRDAEARWQLVKKHFPLRHREFLHASINNADKPVVQRAGPVMPFSRVAEYAALFGDLTLADDVVEAAIQVVEELMCDMTFSQPPWQQQPDVNVTDVLLQRLLWPSPLVRERAAAGIASLLLRRPTRTAVASALISWLKCQSLETICVIGLLPVLKACQVNSKVLSKKTLQQIVASIRCKSLVLDSLVGELSILTGSSLAIDAKPIEPAWATPAYKPPKDFEKHSTAYVTPIYEHYAKEIERTIGYAFRRHWSATIDAILRDHPSLPSWDSNHYFCGTPTTPVLTAFALRKSEVYRSAFVRVVEYLYQRGILPETLAFKYLFATIPIDLSLWNILPQRCPVWWPQQLPAGPAQDGLEVVGLRESIRSLVNIRQNGRVLLSLHGSIKPATQWDEDGPTSEIKVSGFAYRITGPRFPSADQVAEAIQDVLICNTLSPTREANLRFNKLVSNHCMFLEGGVKVADIEISPLAVLMHEPVILMWQWYRVRNAGIQILSPFWDQGLTLAVNTNEWHYMHDDQLIARCADWTEGVAERHNLHSIIPAGTWCEINEEYLTSLLSAQGMRLGYIATVATYHSRSTFDQPETIKSNELINVSPLIIP